jgi:hypothetical protein
MSDTVQHTGELLDTSFENGTLIVRLDGGIRSFACAPALTLALRAWWRRLRLGWCEEHNRDPEEAVPLIDLLTYVLDEEDRTADCLALAYPGNHDGIDWYGCCAPEAVEEALAHFFVSCFAKGAAKTGASQISSSLSVTNCTENL